LPVAQDQLLSHYRLVEKLGEGGMGVVWRATDTRLDREVAVKLLPEDLEADPDRLASFIREAKLVAALSHPNIVTIHSIEEAAGHHFLVMELVRGLTLDRIIPEDGLPLPRFFELGLAIADAVGAAHGRAVIHRDLKPRNIMVDEEGRVKVLDFGLARLHRATRADDDHGISTQTLSSRGGFEGTVSYMSPEQVHGDPPDHRSDLFSLGGILYEMATGCRPFTGRTVAAVIAAILRDDPPAVTELRPVLPRQLERILRHALQKDPQRRFQSVVDLRNELADLREEIAGGAPCPAIRSLAVLPLDDLAGDPDQAFFADGMTDALISNLARIRALKVISRTSVMQYKGVKKPLPVTARELGVDAVVEGSVLRAGRRVRVTAQLIDAARDRLLWTETYDREVGDVLTLQSEIARGIAQRIEVEVTPQERAHLARAGRRIDLAVHEAYLKGRYFWHKRTAESVRHGLLCFEEAVRLDPSHAPAHAGIADSYIVDGGRYLDVPPKIAYARARAAALRAIELEDSLAEAHNSLAAVLTDYDWDWAGADREYRRSIELNPNYVTAHSWYAEHLSRMGRHAEAVAEARRALELDPVSTFSSMLVAWILYFARRYDEAIGQATKTLELDPEYVTALRILGWAYEESGRLEEAIAAHRKACELTQHRPNFEAQLGRAFALAGRTDEAREVLAGLAKVSAESYVSAFDIAIIHTALGDRERAFEWLERAFEERSDHLPYLGVNPRVDALRGDPRFRDLLARMGLPGGTGPGPLGAS
jgi:serine/threonine-protein kinase